MGTSYAHHLRAAITSKQLRFIVAGLLNTFIDFAVFNFVLHVFDAKIWVANICSTSIAMVVSFALNKKAVFGDKKHYSHQQFIAFVIVTAAGLWGLQTLTVVGLSNFLKQTIIGTQRSTNSDTAISWLIPNLAKGAATIVSAVWNYFWYDRVIFTQKHSKLSEWM